MTDKEKKKLEKMLYYALGRRPDEFGLVPQEGFVRLKDLHRALIEVDGFKNIRLKKLKDFFLIFKPERFEFNEEKEIVRVKPELAAEEIYIREFSENPPTILYVTVKPKAWIKISEEGLASEAIVLTPDKELAQKMAKRKGALVIKVDTKKAMSLGTIFERFIEKLFLTSWIPAEALKGPKVDEAFKKRYLPPPKKEKKPPIILEIEPSFQEETKPAEEVLPYRKITKGRKKDPAWKKAQRIKRRERL
ncbi:phosphotransferase KptA/Tpt1 [Thermodesulfatator indicus DSM 15286]|uniref:Phosphotransferase KptA/Tpt1 n=1 Tax=Thermodesulfatator indicus (strain DSM 15286 / JCM 11887 / CIR29812) TaxID=667014 RepID=F8ACJ1_THEID|nr:RNA 2'-phosphotransferase [Thermodesulfatator indicus]AEH44695.1 phosphotransferase KptA/Tpt1 [Thermodesulfatator indicus DSM 15286]